VMRTIFLDTSYKLNRQSKVKGRLDPLSCLFHDSLMQIVFIMLTAGTLLLVTGIAIQYIPGLQPNIKGRKSATPV